MRQVLVRSGPNLGRPGSREFRHSSVVPAVADGTIAGFGYMSCQLALQTIAGLAAAAEVS